MIIASFITFIFFVIKCIEQKAKKVVKIDVNAIIYESIYVFVSGIVGVFLMEQFDENVNLEKVVTKVVPGLSEPSNVKRVGKSEAMVFSGNPDF